MEMDINEKLQIIWSEDYINELPIFIKERGFLYSDNRFEKDILITGFNPSFRTSDKIDYHYFDFQNILKDTTWDNYWGSLKKLIHDPIANIDLRSKCAYLDLFYFREKTQFLFQNTILNSQAGIRFTADQLNLTQHIIEDIIKPRFIIVKNKESAAYWGRYANDGFIWMGYQFDFIQSMVCGDLYKISGLINSNERISPEIKETNLKGSLVLFTHHINQYTKKEKRPTALLINQLLEDIF